MIYACSVVTDSSLSEFLLLKVTLESYHQVSWTVSCDPVASAALSAYKNVKVLNLIESDQGCSHGTQDADKTKKFTQLAMTKFDAVEDSIRNNGYGLFLDADVFFTNPIEDRVLHLIENQDVDAVLCPHMTNNLGLETQVGHYNTGMFSLRSLDMLRKHVALSSNPANGFYTDQQAIQFAAYEHTIVGLPIHYNIGWWRFNEKFNSQRLSMLKVSDNKIVFGNSDAVCFHIHTLKKLDYKNYGTFLLDRVISMMKSCDNPRYAEAVRMIESCQ